MMNSRFNAEKAVEAAGVILRANGKRVTRLRLLKLLYLADRLALSRHGMPIIGGKVVAMDYGPLHSDILDLINNKHAEEPRWSKYFQSGTQIIEMTDEPSVKKLSPDEVEILNEIAMSYQEKNDWRIVQETHELPEWIEFYSQGTSTVIPLRNLVKEVCGEEYADEIVSEIEEQAIIHDLFSSPTGTI